jgi:Flp pilus assembly protein TadD
MSPKPLFAVSASVLVLALAGGAQAWPFQKKEAAPAAAPAPAAGQASAKPTAPTGPRKANTAERAQADRLDPLARAVFWAHEADVDPGDIEAGLKLSQTLRVLGRNDEAADAATKVLVMHPANAEALLELGRDHIARGQGFYAVDPLQRAAAGSPRDWRAQSLLGVALEQVSRHDDARQAWAKALSLSPDNPTVLSNMAMAYVTAGDPAQAEPLLRKAIAQPSATLQTRENLALVLGLQGKAVEAERIIRQDLPPELAEQNLAWLRARMAPAATVTPAAASANPAAPRTWSSVQGNSGGN